MTNACQDSTYLSFYYQPQGYGNAPEYNDSLILQVISKGKTYPIWYSNGIDYESFKVAISKLSELSRTLNEGNTMTHYIESAKEELKKDYAK